MKVIPKNKTENSSIRPNISRLSMTHHLLLIQFSNRVIILIEEIAELYLGVSVNTAKRKAKIGELPFPVFKMSQSAKSPYVVHIDDLAKYIENKAIEAELFRKAFNREL